MTGYTAVSILKIAGITLTSTCTYYHTDSRSHISDQFISEGFAKNADGTLTKTEPVAGDKKATRNNNRTTTISFL